MWKEYRTGLVGVVGWSVVGVGKVYFWSVGVVGWSVLGVGQV